MRKIILIIGFLSITAWPSCAAITVVQHKFIDTTASGLTAAVTVTSTGSGHHILVCQANSGARTVISVGDTKNTYTQFAGAASHGTFDADCWYTSSSVSGATTITSTFSGTAGTFDKVSEVWETSGWISPIPDGHAAVPSGSAASNIDTGASVTTTGTVGFLGAIIIVSNSVTSNPLSGNAFTSGGDLTNNDNAACSLISTTAAGHQPQWGDTNGSTFTTITVAFKESAGGAATMPPSIQGDSK